MAESGCFALFLPLIASSVVAIITGIVRIILRRNRDNNNNPQEEEEVIPNIIPEVVERNDIIDDKQYSFTSIDIVNHHHKMD